MKTNFKISQFLRLLLRSEYAIQVKTWKWLKLLNSVPFIKKPLVNQLYIRIWSLRLTFTVLQWMKKNSKNGQFSGFSGALWQGSSTENWAKSLKLSRMTAGYFIDTKFGMVTHTVNSNLKPLLFFKKVTWLSISGVKTIQIWPLNFGSKQQSDGYLQNLQKMALTAWDKVYFSNPTGSFKNRYLLFTRLVIYLNYCK